MLELWNWVCPQQEYTKEDLVLISDCFTDIVPSSADVDKIVTQTVAVPSSHRVGIALNRSGSYLSQQNFIMIKSCQVYIKNKALFKH